MSKPDVLAVAKLHPFYQKALESLYTVHDRTHVTDPAAFAALAPRIVGVAGTGEASVPRSLLAQLPNAKVVAVFGVGYDGVDVPAAIEHGIPVTHTPDVLTDDVADLAMGLVLSVGRAIPQADQFVRAGQWPSGPMALGRKVSGARLGIVGLGRIGKAIAKRASAFGMSIAYTARTAKAGSGYTFYPSAAELAANVDFLVAITPGGAGTKHLINAEVLKALGGKGAIVVDIDPAKREAALAAGALSVIDGKAVASYPLYRFNTGGPAVQDSRPYDGDSNIDENQTFLFKFDGENDVKSLPASTYCLIGDLKEKIPLRFYTVDEARRFADQLPEDYRQWWNRPGPRERRAVQCARQLPPGSKVKLVLAKGLASKTGVVRSADQALTFRVRPAFTASFTCTRENARQACAPMTDMRIEFTDTVSAERLKAVRLEGGERTWMPVPNAAEGEEYYEGGGTGPDDFIPGTVATFRGPFPSEATFTLRLPPS